MSLMFVAAMAMGALLPSRLQCESLENPLGMDVARPRLSWIVASSEMGQRQSAYRIRVASDKRILARGRGDLWDTGKVASSETRDILYAGKALNPAQRVFWNVQVWDRKGAESTPSAPATWTMHIVGSDWKPVWIGMNDRPLPRKGIGFHAAEANSLNQTKWVQVDLGKGQAIAKVLLHPVHNHTGYPLFGFPVRFRVETSDDAEFGQSSVLLDETKQDFEVPEKGPVEVQAGISARYVRITATRLWPRKDGVGCFALAELEVRDAAGHNVSKGKPVMALDSVERDGWTKDALTDGFDADNEPITLLLRNEFSLSKPVKRALCFVTGLGQYELRINGKKVGEDWITPGWTQYAKSVLVDSYDVTPMFRKGSNAVGMILGNGMYDMSSDSRGSQQQNSLGIHKGTCTIRIEHSDGTVSTWDTGNNWRCAPGPETYSGVFGGEDWDARLEPIGWDKPGFDDHAWARAKKVTPPAGALHGITHSAPPLRTFEVREPIHATAIGNNTLVFDLGQNAPYVPEIRVKGAAGASIRMWPAEMLKPDGTVEQRTIRAGKFATYTLRGGKEETWHPLFWYCGSRYWQVETFDAKGRPTDPKELLIDFHGLMVHGSERAVGTFECSDRLFNQIYSLIRWAMVSNFASVISDCPHREKSGWLEEDHLVGPGLMYCFDMTTMFRKVVEDMHDTQQPNGMVPTMAPEYFFYDAGYRDSVEWGGTYLFLPRYMRDWYADAGLISRHYPAMKRYVDYLGVCAKDGILSTGLGDWTGYGNDPRTPVAITDTAYYYYAVHTLSEFAKSLGHKQDAVTYGGLAQRIKHQFHRSFFDPATGKVGTGSQSGQATALDLGLIDGPDREKAFEQMLADVKAHDYAVSCGEVGHPSLLRVLSDFGRSDVVATIHSQTDKPGYGFQIQKGMTTLTEAWDASPISLNHFMLGHIMEWFFADLVGIKPDPEHPGFRSFVVRPQPVRQVAWVKGSYDSIRGPISCAWRLDKYDLVLDIDVPANCVAHVFVPGVFKDVRDRNTDKRVKVSQLKNGEIRIEGGQYRFRSHYEQMLPE